MPAVILQPSYNLILLNADIATLKQPPRWPTPAPVSSPSSSLPTSTPFPKSPTYRGYWKALAT